MTGSQPCGVTGLQNSGRDEGGKRAQRSQTCSWTFHLRSRDEFGNYAFDQAKEEEKSEGKEREGERE